MSGTMTVVGGQPLYGTVRIPAAKNSVLPLLAASLLCEGTVRLCGVPRLSDVEASLALLRGVGCEARRKGSDLVVEGPPQRCRLPEQEAGQMRASILFAAPLLARLGRVETVFPGGCCIGARPIDQTIKGMTALGADVRVERGVLYVSTMGLSGSEVYLDMPSVGATVNTMLTAVSARGNTIIYNGAKEPHIVDLANFLNSMGARIKGAGTDVIRVMGGRPLHGSNYAVIPDQIETGTLMIAAAATGGDVVITGAIPTHMEALSAKLLEMGVYVGEDDDRIHIRSDGNLRAVNIKTQVYPGFPTDLQQPMAALLCTANGSSTITETIFENRFRYLEELKRMGADIRVFGRTAVVDGIDRLIAAPVTATDLRAGASMIVAGLMAEGITDIYGVNYILRGYDGIDRKLRSLGAKVEMVLRG